MTAEDDGAFGPWNPGLVSSIPRALLPLSTMFRGESVTNDLAAAEEAAEATGIPATDLSAFRPERLVAHEVIIRVTADLQIPDGPRYEELGLNLRGMIAKILDDHVTPEMPRLVATFEALREETLARLKSELDTALAPPAAPEPEPPSFLARLVGRRPAPPPVAPGPNREERVLAALGAWSKRAERERDDAHQAACLHALSRIVGAIVRTRGRLLAETDTIVGLAATQVMNGHGSDVLGAEIQPIFDRAVKAEGYRVLPPQSDPFIMNVKGASASGKSTMRSLQRELAGRLGVPWEDFALISPDYWRKFLLDYDSLGEHHKYAAALTGHELAVIDRKLDHYMACKAESGRMSHLLIDRFRFDSFAPHHSGHADTRLLTRFGSKVYLFFVVTPPEATVERAWKRGLRTGRFKAVDDLLYHNIEAFTGMPQLFLSWALSSGGREIHYEFLDNGVEMGERPISIASGRNGALSVYDVTRVLDIERFRKIDIEARGPGEVYDAGAHEPADNLGFLRTCIERLARVEFVDPGAGRVYGATEGGRWTLWDAEAAPEDAARLLPELGAAQAPQTTARAAEDLETARRSTVGRLV